DTGISGRAAQAVAEKLSEVSLNHQVICVTHLPQIASMADTHFYIEKSVSSGKTRTTVKKLDYKSEVNELARMLGSAKITDLTLRHAEEMINMAKGIKRDFIKKQ
ncbi:MAG TPA: DNA repair protein RecN, partial [Clostridiaceae bacterium]|nr:DNA repair protein RecN [Clostridiaceae bacterium]